jgi:hypothetical protein
MNFDWYRRNGFQLRLTPDNARYLYEKNGVIIHCADGRVVGFSLEGGAEDD